MNPIPRFGTGAAAAAFLVAGSGLEFEDRGEHDLKGVPGSWQLYALRS